MRFDGSYRSDVSMIPVSTHDVPEQLRSVPGAAPLIDALSGEPRVWVAGGAVRDVLLGREPVDVDFVVEGDSAEVARRAADAAGADLVVHDRFGTATVGSHFNFASTRRERYPAPGALPEVELGAPLREDLARRDFTINAIAVRLADGEGEAWPGAFEDLAERRLRVLHPRSFVDDPTRLLRLVRYGARLRFPIEEETRTLAFDAVADGALGTVTGPRLGAELRLLTGEPQPTAVCGLEGLRLGPRLLPGFRVDPDRVERALRLCPSPVLALAACCIDAEREQLAERVEWLGFPARERDTLVAAATRAQELATDMPGLARPSEVWRRLRHERPETVALAGALGHEVAEDVARRWLQDLRHTRLAITGDDLLAAGLEGPAVGRALEAAMEAVLDGEASGRDEQLAAALGRA